MIPKHLHFVFGLAPGKDGEPRSPSEVRKELVAGWGLVHYACLRSAITKINPTEVSLYLQNEPSGPWWELTKPLVNLVEVKAPSQIFGNPLTHYAHKADVIRLEKLLDHGGIYLDADVFVHDSFDHLLNNSVVMGKEGSKGLCNAVILAERNAPFLAEWYESYRSFDQAQWNYHSVTLPFELSKQSKFEGRVQKLPETAFFWPSWRARDIYKMFGAKPKKTVRGDLANHLWEQRAKFYVGGLTPGHVRAVNSPFHTWVRPYVADLPDDFGEGLNTFFIVPRHLFARAHNLSKIIRSGFE